jgi:hypothetical protein
MEYHRQGNSLAIIFFPTGAILKSAGGLGHGDGAQFMIKGFPSRKPSCTLGRFTVGDPDGTPGLVPGGTHPPEHTPEFKTTFLELPGGWDPEPNLESPPEHHQESLL